MEESDSGTFSKSLNVSKLASMFQKADITFPVRPKQVLDKSIKTWSPGEVWKVGLGWTYRLTSEPLFQRKSQVPGGAGLQENDQVSSGNFTYTWNCCRPNAHRSKEEPPRRRSPSPGSRTEALVQNFTQLGGGGSSNNISKNNSCDVGFKDVLRPAQTWRRSLPDCSRISTENKENSAQFNFSRLKHFMLIFVLKK